MEYHLGVTVTVDTTQLQPARPQFQRDYHGTCREGIAFAYSEDLQRYALAGVVGDDSRSDEFWTPERRAEVAIILEPLRTQPLCTIATSIHTYTTEALSTSPEAWVVFSRALEAIQSKYPELELVASEAPVPVKQARFNARPRTALTVTLHGHAGVFPAWWWVALVQRICLYMVKWRSVWPVRYAPSVRASDKLIPAFCFETSDTLDLWTEVGDAEETAEAWEKMPTADAMLYLLRGYGPVDITTHFCS
jgi:hypothetical protein